MNTLRYFYMIGNKHREGTLSDPRKFRAAKTLSLRLCVRNYFSATSAKINYDSEIVADGLIAYDGDDMQLTNDGKTFLETL